MMGMGETPMLRKKTRDFSSLTRRVPAHRTAHTFPAQALLTISPWRPPPPLQTRSAPALS